MAAVISGRPASPDFAGYIRHFAHYPAIVGVRQVLHVADAPPGLCLTPAYVQGVRLLGELGLSFDICLRPRELGDAVKLVAQCPETRFVIDHCGNGDPYIIAGEEATNLDDPFAHGREEWMADIAALAGLPNTVCKISGIVARARPGWTAETLAPAVNHCLDSFGFDRVLFGGDWPVCMLGAGASYAAWVFALAAIVSKRSAQAQAALFYDNAVAFYGLA